MEDMVKGKSLFRSLAVMLLVLISLSLVFTTSCSSSTPTTTTPPATTAPPPSVTVTIEDFTILLSTITVPVGTTVIWSNLDPEEHTITSDTGLFDGLLSDPVSDPINAIFSYTFTEPGTFYYHCNIHSASLGMVIVE